MPLGIADTSPLLDNSGHVSATELMNDNADQTAKTIALKDLVRQANQAQLVRDTVAQNTVTDPTTGNTAVDQKSVLNHLYLTDPQAAAVYEQQQQQRAANLFANQQAQLKVMQDQATFTNSQQDRNIKLIQGELGNIDPDSKDAPAQYAASVSRLKSMNVPIPPEDEQFDPAKVRQWQQQLIGAKDQFDTKAKADLQAGENATKLEGDRILAGGKITVAGINAGAKNGVYPLPTADPVAIFKNMVGSGKPGDAGIEGGVKSDGTFAVSPKGAFGPAQLMPNTLALASRLTNIPVDQLRTDPQANLQGGQAVFNYYSQQFGSPVLGAAAYNAGPAAVQAAIDKAGGSTDPSVIIPYLPKETQSYVSRAAGVGVSTKNAQDPDAVDYWARRVLGGDNLAQVGKSGTPFRDAVTKRIAEMSGQSGSTPGEDQARVAANKANTTSLANLQKQADAATAFEKTATSNIDVALQAASQIKGQSDNQLRNKAVNAIKRAKGDPDILAADAALQTAATEIAKVTNSANANGVLSDTARHELLTIMDPDAPYKTRVAVYNKFKQDMSNRTVAYNQQLQQVRGRIANGGKSGVVDPAQTATPTVGQVATDANGPYRVVSGNGGLYKQRKNGSLERIGG